MKYLESKFQVAMPGGKGEWPWPERDTVSSGNTTIMREEGETLPHFLERALFSVRELPDSEQADAIREHGGSA
jgi:hypothetical protein